MSDDKAEVDTVEYTETVQQHHGHHDVILVQGNEDEVSSVYQLGWKTILALISLYMANSCAALANTVCSSHGSISTDTDELFFVDQYCHQIPGCIGCQKRV